MLRKAGLWSSLQLGAQIIGLASVLLLTPLQLHNMGTERYGILVLAVTIAGYVTLLETGVGWGLTREIAARGGARDHGPLIGAGLVITAPLALATSVSLWIFSPTLATSVFNVSRDSIPEATFALRAAAVALPFMIATNFLIGIARGHRLFAGTVALAAFLPLTLNVVWAVAASSDNSVQIVSATLVTLQVLAVLGFVFYLSLSHVSIWPKRPRRDDLRVIGAFGGLHTFGTLGSSALTSFDTLIVAAVLPVASLPYYSLPFAFASRIMLASGAVVAVVMPLVASGDSGRSRVARRLSSVSSQAVLLFSAVFSAAIGLGGRAFLELYVGKDFADQSWVALLLLAVAFLFLSASSMNVAHLEAAGRAGRAALPLVCGSLVGLPLVYAGAQWIGISGAAGGVLIGGVVTTILANFAEARYKETTAFANAKSLVVEASGIWMATGIVYLIVLAVDAPPLINLVLVSITALAAGSLFFLRMVRNVKNAREEVRSGNAMS
jgi:O-antigen/teichoic acid export membrane protein